MAQQHEIEFFISEEGELKVHVKGIKGPGCIKTLESLAGKIGKEKERTLTSEYYETEKGRDTGKTSTKG